MSTLVVGFIVGVASSVAGSILIAYRQRLQFHLSFRRVLRRIVVLADRIAADGYSPDYVVAIDRNSGVVGSILAASFGLHPAVSVGTDNLRHPDGTRNITIPDPYRAALDELGGKKVLVVICCNDTGTSLGHVVDHLQSRSTPPAEIRTCALYSSVSPAVRPRYVGAIVGEDIRMPMNRILRSLPWVTAHWRLVFAEERHHLP